MYNIQIMKIGVLGSGGGSNLQSIIDAVENGSLPVEIAIVISDVQDAYILERAKKHNIPAQYIAPGKFKTKLEPEVEKKYAKALKDAGVELVVLAGYMRMVKEELLGVFPGRIINIHPAILPSFKGLHAWKQALDYGVKVSGCTVHFVDTGMDTGPIIIQAAVPVLDNDTFESLHQRIQFEEHKIYPQAIKFIAEGKIETYGRVVKNIG